MIASLFFFPPPKPMVTPVTLTDPFDTIWYHGTHAKPFSTWKCPPPPPSPADVGHTGLFFTADQGYAKHAGTNICTIKLSPETKLIVPARGGNDSSALRQAVTRCNSIATYCQWLISDAVWTDAWATGQVTRFSFDTSNHKHVYEIGLAVARVAANLKKMIKTPVPEQLLMNQALMCLTRGWIEQLVLEARKLGYQAIQGAEIDRWSAPNATPVAQSWLAVMDASVITAPAWL
ncbi:MAG TPA: hypothetical protein VFF81_12045 [Noviherbaspirillum sp.]|nr:hypothetical protein [Noviherbaspirillum sp.]